MEPFSGASELDRLVDEELKDLIRRVQWLGENFSYSLRYDLRLRSVLESLNVCRKEIATTTGGTDGNTDLPASPGTG